MKLARLILLLLFTSHTELAVALPSPPKQPRYKMSDLSPLTETGPLGYVFAHGVNQQGVVVGEGGPPVRWPMAEDVPTIVEELGAPIGAGRSTPLAVNDHGLTVGFGWYGIDSYRPLIWSGAGKVEVMGDLPGGEVYGMAFDVNNAGIAVGVSGAATGNRAFRWTSADGMEDLGDLPGGVDFSEARSINERGDIVGVSGALGGNRGFIWREDEGFTQLSTLPGGQVSAAYGVNELGEAVGISYAVAGGITYQSAVIWSSSGEIHAIESLGPGSSQAVAVNNFGWVVGQSFDQEGLARGFVWTSEHGTLPLDELVVNPPAAPAYFRIFDAKAINDRGQIAAWAYSTRGVNSVLLTPVPEPTSLFLASTTGLALVTYSRRRAAITPRKRT